MSPPILTDVTMLLPADKFGHRSSYIDRQLWADKRRQVASRTVMNRRVREHNRSYLASPCRFPITKVLILISVLIPIVLADQNLATDKSPPVFITTDTRPPIMASITHNDELLMERMDHIKTVWMRNHPYYLRVLSTEGIHNWYDLIKFLKNKDIVNSVKNRTASSDDEDDENYDGTLTSYWHDRFRYTLSYINELQIDHGILHESLVDISSSDYHEFCNYCDGAPSFQPYSNALAREAAVTRATAEFRLREAEAKAAAAEAFRDKALDEAYHANSSDVRSNSRSISDPSQTNSARGRDALDRFRTKWGNTNSFGSNSYPSSYRIPKIGNICDQEEDGQEPRLCQHG
eukprot:scaffold11478_cov139-Skeletonema_marinoi.AAC.2